MPYPFIPKPSQFDERWNKQFNIMALVGNGFDIQVMHEYEQRSTTRYPDFYYFMKMKNVDSSNLVLGQMEQALADGKPNWSDVEACIDVLARQRTPVDNIRSALDEVRTLFSEFLNGVVTSALLADLGKDSQDNHWAQTSLSTFLRDLESREDLNRVPFGMRKGFYDIYNFYFVNFNYTALLDDYVYIDPVQFDPVPYSTVDTNFTFNTDPKKLSGDSWNYNSSTNVEVQVVHPHGYQDVPRSILFGTNGDGNKRGATAKLAKTYWGQVDARYGHMFDDTHLFIVFGCSLGRTDSWWWSHIAESLASADENSRALLIYWWNPLSQDKETRAKVIDVFLDVANVVDDDVRSKISQRICVVSYNDDDERIWLSTSRQS